MTVYVGPTNWWWRDSPDAPIGCKIKSVLRLNGVGGALSDGSRIVCASNNIAWIVAPSTTQVSSSYPGTGDKCCVCDWSTLNTQLINCGFNPSDWFVPSRSQLQNPGYVCRTNWDSFSVAFYWSSTEFNATNACGVNYTTGNATNNTKAGTYCVRAFRCVTY